ncbi:hypothetical protein WMY93_015935 [Mugilogobius chulae]|uniref:Osteoclast-stimulating factor 1 n=1 Tax=Mugilogobius chulae TaxID=88201 RepID=A0AAW0NVU4_9GOBI
MEVVVEYDYEALHEDELTLRPGDIIKNVRCIEEDGWMEGELNGRRGLFPDNFVKEVKKDPKESKEAKPEPKETKNEPKEEAPAPLREKPGGNVANLVNRMSTIGFPIMGLQPHPPAASKKPKKRQCKVLFDYQPQNEDELELKLGDIVDITEEVEEGWWSGTLNGKSGLFPSNFVKEMDATTEDRESSETVSEETSMKDEENASTPTSPPGNLGNGALRPPNKVRGVGFGNIFPEGAPKKLKPVPVIPSTKPAHSSHSTPTSTETSRGAAEIKSSSLKRAPKEYCKVTFAFEATNEDELTLKEGDIIHILSKDTGEPGWWRGEVGGKEGVFPDNFVTIVSETEKDASTLRGSLKTSLRPDPEEKPRKPLPPSKQGPKPVVPSVDKKPIRSEDSVDKHLPEKHSKPAPLPPPKPSASGKTRSTHPPKRPDKPLAPTPSLKHNGEAPSVDAPDKIVDKVQDKVPEKPAEKPTELGNEEFRKSLTGILNKNRPPSVDGPDKTVDQVLDKVPEKVSEKPTELDLDFDELASTSHRLSHPTVERPRMPGRRPPTMFLAHSPTKEVNVEKSFKVEEEETAKPKLTETKKPSSSNLPQSPSHLRTSLVIEAKSSPSASSGGGDSTSVGVKGRLEPEEPSTGYEELRNQMRDLLLTVELLKTQQMKEISELRGELDEERHKRMALQVTLISMETHADLSASITPTQNTTQARVTSIMSR